MLVQIDTSVFYRILEPEKTVYRIRDVDGAIVLEQKVRLSELNP